ncbi:MAG TPA: dimethylmenaquinone methyltransferase [Candidatus Latescibacteria bacterium]|jgi:4-hydroxy-4-methyl-2-oxoglutarate aldolase|nr:dimethylmenaquinone methyltransferase [Candidatus Latescibacterota bacterium]
MSFQPEHCSPPLPFTFDKEQIRLYTHLFEGERFPDGRPKVPDSILDRMKRVTCEQAWTILRQHDYECQYQGKWGITHGNPVLVGRAVTCNFIPHRPDVADVVAKEAHQQGLQGRDKHWVMDRLVKDDVIVADLMDKQIGGGFFGDNLANMIREKTGTGAVVWGGTRDLAGILELEDFIVFNRNWDPSTSGSYDKSMVIGYNTPIVIGRAAVMPGDVVLGLKEGVVFVPAHLAQEVVETSELIALKDTFGFERLKAGTYTGGQIDGAWATEISEDFYRWVRDRIDSLPHEQQAFLRKQDWF